jgi:SNF2 family DNA or RNA helicase
MLMLTRNDFYPYQEHGVEHILDNPACGLFLEMGLGKTATSLTGIDILMNDMLEVDRVLVIAPKRVAESVWEEEAKKWEHLRHLKFAKILGTEAQRLTALRSKADIYLINRENVAWLVGFYGSKFPFDMVVIDELSSFKSAKSIRFKALRRVRPQVKRVIGLTGTPAPNGMIDLWSQMYLLDKGERLGKTLTEYRDNYFKPGKRKGEVIYTYDLKTSEYESLIHKKISDICISMKSKDYLKLPKRIDRNIDVRFPKKIMDLYEQFEEDQVMALRDQEITAVNAAALTTKLMQFANGAIYDDDKKYHEIHQEKLKALEEIADVSNGKPLLVFYTFKHDVERILAYLKSYKPEKLTQPTQIDRWNKGEIPIMLGHPASMGHGLNLQAGGHNIVWFGSTYSLELYQQAIARLDRQGQKFSVINNRLLAYGTIDEAIVNSTTKKAYSQDILMDAVKARMKKYGVYI